MELEQAEGVRDGRAGAPDAGREVLLGERELVHQLAIGAGRLHRVEVLALEVLDEGELELLPVGELPNDRRDALQAGHAGCANAPLAGDELVAVDRLGDEDRLDHAVLADALGEAREGVVVHPQARLARVLADPRERDLDRAGGRRRTLRDEGGEAAAEALRAVAADGHASTASALASDAAVPHARVRGGRSSRARISSARSR